MDVALMIAGGLIAATTVGGAWGYAIMHRISKHTHNWVLESRSLVKTYEYTNRTKSELPLSVVTNVLMKCDGCGEVKSKTLNGNFTE